MRCKIRECNSPTDNDPIFCPYHLEKVRIFGLYYDKLSLEWKGNKIIGASYQDNNYEWERILTLEDLCNVLHVWDNIDGKPITCDLLDSTDWLPLSLETGYINYRTVDNWLQEPANFDYLKGELEKVGYLVTDMGGRSDFEGMEIWKGKDNWEDFP